MKMKRLFFCIAGIITVASLSAMGRKDSSRSVTIELPGNPTTGYSWTWSTEQEGIVREISAEYVRDGEKSFPGRGGVFVFVFEGLREGSAELVFSYARPWEKDAESAQSVRYSLTVDSKNRIQARKLDE
jgi:predicted secreted protein